MNKQLKCYNLTEQLMQLFLKQILRNGICKDVDLCFGVGLTPSKSF